MNDKTALIRAMNDRLRRTLTGGHVVVTAGIRALGAEFLRLAVQLICSADDFSSANDPYGERDFGHVLVRGEKILWKIDYYDPSLTLGAQDPSDETCCVRVLTIMLASEY